MPSWRPRCLRLKQEGYRPDRDIILALTADEEGGCCNGVNWLLKNHRDLIDAEFVLNQDGWSVMADARRAARVRGSSPPRSSMRITS